MRARAVLPVLAVAAVPLIGTSSVSGATTKSQIRCSTENGVRFDCAVKSVRPDEQVSVLIPKFCDRLRDFDAEPTSKRYKAYDRVGIARSKTFNLVDADGENQKGDSIPTLRVRVDLLPGRIRFINRGKYLVNVGFTERCRP
ncbi:hypothetical protein [Patulibacter sp.]|uniref:hypothetical protein n=1 Tax=Patulibacter sp. TaxID=1912859 RepID=UPI00271E8998|nr:hypothetical protein [Patulibacter sp.]MDO9409688.1 hypothetical protein [Patulibacter sp.]